MFVPAIATTGLPGWSALKRVAAEDTRRLENTPEMTRDRDYAASRLSRLASLDALMEDRRLLGIVLTAHGLGANIDDRALVRKALAEGATSKDAFAAKLGDSRWLELAASFNFDKPFYGLGQARIDRILSDYSARRYAVAVGETDGTLATALKARDKLATLGSSTMSREGRWLTVIGSDELREVFQSALGLPAQFWQLDIDTQVSRLEAKFAARFGSSITGLEDTALQEKLIDRHVALASANDISTTSPAALALALFEARTLF